MNRKDEFNMAIIGSLLGAGAKKSSTKESKAKGSKAKKKSKLQKASRKSNRKG